MDSSYPLTLLLKASPLLEVAGLFLTMIEIYKPDHSGILEEWIDAAQVRFRKNGYNKIMVDWFLGFGRMRKDLGSTTGIILSYIALYYYQRWLWRWVVDHHYNLWIISSIPVAFLILLVCVGLYRKRQGKKGMGTILNILTPLLILLYIGPTLLLMCLLYILFNAVSGMTWLLNHIGRSKALGAIGLLLGGIGLLGEFIQLWQNSNATGLHFWTGLGALAVFLITLFVLLDAASKVRKKKAQVQRTG